MSERKVLQKYYPPDFDPAGFGRRKSAKKDDGPRMQTVRLMAPFSMRCLTCGEYIYKGRKFNSRKMTPHNEKYLSIQIHYFAIKCTRCSAEIVFRTDPKNNDYAMVKGAQRNIEPWHNKAAAEETDEQRLDRLEREEAEAEAEAAQESNRLGGAGRDAMADLEAQDLHARQEMAVADALDMRRQRNARIERAEKDGVSFVDSIVRAGDEERANEERELDELAKREFAAKRAAMEREMEDKWEVVEDGMVGGTPTLPSASTSAPSTTTTDMPPPPKPKTEASSWGAKKKPKRDRAALAGFKRL